MTDFIDVYVKATGAKQRIPAHWLHVPSIARNFSKTPRQRSREAGKRTAPKPRRTRGTTPKAAPVAKDSTPQAGEKEN